VHVALAGLGLQRMWIGHPEGAQTLHHGGDHVGDTLQARHNTARRCAHLGVLVSLPPTGIPMVDAGWKRLLQQWVR
jgi:hypothetical protein